MPIPGQLQLSDPVGRRQVHLASQVGEARGSIGERSKDLGFGDVQQRREAARGPGRVLHLIGSRDDVRRVLRDGQLPALAVQDPTALARDRDRLRVLTLRVGAQPSALHPLHPGRAPDRHEEQQQEAGEQEAYAPLDHLVLRSTVRARPSMNRIAPRAHGADTPPPPPPPVGAAGGLVVSVVAVVAAGSAAGVVEVGCVVAGGVVAGEGEVGVVVGTATVTGGAL